MSKKKKILLIILIVLTVIIGVTAGLALIWFVVFPFIRAVFEGFFNLATLPFS